MTDLFYEASESGVTVEYLRLPLNKSMSVCGQVSDFVLMDYSLINSIAHERVHLAHEIGHCVTGSFYNPYSPLDIRGKHEYRANKWAVHKLIPYSELFLAFKSGVTEILDLAERFDVTEEFIHKTIYIYKCEGKL